VLDLIWPHPHHTPQSLWPRSIGMGRIARCTDRTPACQVLRHAAFRIVHFARKPEVRP
jgi:hypothetical protein